MLSINKFIEALGGLDYIQKTTDETIKDLSKLIGLNAQKVGNSTLESLDLLASTEKIDKQINNFIALKKASEDNLKRCDKLSNLKAIKTDIEKLKELEKGEKTEEAEADKIARNTACEVLMKVVALNIQEKIGNWKNTFKDILEDTKKELSLSEPLKKSKPVKETFEELELAAKDELEAIEKLELVRDKLETIEKLEHIKDSV